MGEHPLLVVVQEQRDGPPGGGHDLDEADLAETLGPSGLLKGRGSRGEGPVVLGRLGGADAGAQGEGRA